MIIADTDVLIDALKGQEPGRGRVAEAIQSGALATTAITVFELMAGAKSESARASIDALLTPLRILNLDDLASQRAAEFRRRLERDGRKIGLADYLIAGICHSHAATLLTRNLKHFERIEELRVEAP